MLPLLHGWVDKPHTCGCVHKLDDRHACARDGKDVLHAGLLQLLPKPRDDLACEGLQQQVVVVCCLQEGWVSTEHVQHVDRCRQAV